MEQIEHNVDAIFNIADSIGAMAAVLEDTGNPKCAGKLNEYSIEIKKIIAFIWNDIKKREEEIV